MVLKWLKKLFYGTKDGLPQKKVSDEDLKRVEEYLEEHKDIIEVVKPYQMKSPITILEDAGYSFEFVDKGKDLKKYGKVFTINDYSTIATKRFLCMCAILHILGEDIEAYVYASDEDKTSKYHRNMRYVKHIRDCFIPMDELLELVQRNMRERNCYTTSDECCYTFHNLSCVDVMFAIYESPLEEYAHYSDRYI